MKDLFCFLEKDEKTYGYVICYFNVIKEGKSLMSLDALIQKEEIEKHLRNNDISKEDREAVASWIKKNSSNFRSYLNSIKMVALFIFFLHRNSGYDCGESVSFETFCRIAGMWNERKICTADSIFK